MKAQIHQLLPRARMLRRQLDLLPRQFPKSPSYGEIRSAEDLRDPKAVLARLRSIDWAFEEEDTSYLSHDIHPYPAKFIPQIPGHLIANLSARGELVCDPFGGSGTAAFEAIRLGRRALSIDANPVATLIGRVKVARLDEMAALDLRVLRASIRNHQESLPSATELLNQYRSLVPDIPNIDKWFPQTSRGELALLRSIISRLESQVARDVASLALSRIVLRSSFQDSETRYASKPREIPQRETLESLLRALSSIERSIAEADPELALGVVEFATADTRCLDAAICPDSSVDLVLTSPPYGNANDYHLYHRFRIFWLGSDPRDLAGVEIGSHLKHQREKSGFESYIDDLRPCMNQVCRILRPGSYAAFVVGSSVYKGKTCDTGREIQRLAKDSGLEVVGELSRSVHKTRRSFVAPGRRTDTEAIVILRKPPEKVTIRLVPPSYRMWEYEEELRRREIEALTGECPRPSTGGLEVKVDPYTARRARRLTFTRQLQFEEGHTESTWQQILENGIGANTRARKDPKYATHGIHAYKGKFYPQLAKSLINITGAEEGSCVLDPFCGSGTTLLEARLNGLRGFGCDLHPLAAKIARAKIGILDVDPKIVTDTLTTLLCKVDSAPTRLPTTPDQLPQEALGEIASWFPGPVVLKLDWLLRQIRSVSAGVVRDFLEVLLSSLLREVSHQDPSDLRIRRRKNPLEDADALGLFRERLLTQRQRLERYWCVAGYNPNRCFAATVVEGDARDARVLSELGLKQMDVDLILTSPPYATALPYIDTDRLSLLVLFGMRSQERRPLEMGLTGSREILTSERKQLESLLETPEVVDLPKDIVEFILSLHAANQAHVVGFRRRNRPSLLLRFFMDMQLVLRNCHDVLKEGAEAILVVGDNTTKVGEKVWRIPTTDFVWSLGASVGLEHVERIPITVTTENMKHIRHAIRENTVLRLRRPVA